MLVAGDDVVVVEAATPGVTVTPGKDLDPTRRSATVTLSSVALDADSVLAGAARRARALARTLGAAEAVGGMAACTDYAVEYAKERVQFGRTIGTFQAIKHHCANLLVAAELATAAVWDAARAAHDTEDEFVLTAAMAANLAFAPAVQSAQMNIQVHGGIAFTWEHDAHLYLRRALVLNALLGTPRDAEDVTAQTAAGTTRGVTLDLPPEAETIRAEVRTEAQRIGKLSGAEQRKALIESGLMVPHWPRPWGRDAGAVEQIVIDQELTAAGVEGTPGWASPGWNITDGEPVRHPGPGRALGLQDAGMGQYVCASSSASPMPGRTQRRSRRRASRVDGGWVVTGPEGVDQRGAVLPTSGWPPSGPIPDAPKHAGITTMVIDMHAASGVEVRPLRPITGSSDFSEVFFNDVFVPDDDVVGTPDDGWTVARSTLGNERVSIGGGSGGIFPTMDLLDLLAAPRRPRGRRRGARGRRPDQGTHAEGAEPAPNAACGPRLGTRARGQRHQVGAG